MTQDIKWDGQDVVRGDDGDLATVVDEDAAIQALAVLVRGQVRPLLGDTVTPTSLAQATTAVNDAIADSADFDGIRSLAITEINKQTNTVNVRASTTTTRDDFEFTVNV